MSWNSKAQAFQGAILKQRIPANISNAGLKPEMILNNGQSWGLDNPDTRTLYSLLANDNAPARVMQDTLHTPDAWENELASVPGGLL